jgi:pimeloyl-ACP methyl ester carboxylesterase
MRSEKISRRGLFLSGAVLGAGQMARAEGVKRPIVLVHGSWHGAWCWRSVERILRRAGHEVFVPTLSGLADRAHLATRALNLSSHVDDVARLLAVEDLESAVLVGHSYGGMVVTAAGAKEHMRLARIVYLDAMVPESGQCGFDVFSPAIAERWRKRAKEKGDGWLVPPMLSAKDMGVEDAALAAKVDAKLTPMPIGTFEEKVTFDAAALKNVERAYVRCARFSGFGPTAERVKKLRWKVRELDCGHDAMLAAPEALAATLIELSA